MDDKSAIHKMTHADNYNQFPDFKLYPFLTFSTNLKTLQKAVEKRKKLVKQEEEEFHKQQLAFPRNEMTSRGELYWDTHPANFLLQEDVKNGVDETLTPQELRKTRKEYQEFTPATFRKHIYQEKRTQRDKNYWIPLRNEQGMKKYKKEVAALKDEFDTQHQNEEIEDMNELFGGLNLNWVLVIIEHKKSNSYYFRY